MKPQFIMIGAMKCGTSTLHDQLAAQPGIFMTTPKEPNYFSDDAIFRRGSAWYEGLFEPSGAAQLRGESSTHYSKLPTYPDACSRMKQALPHIKLIYMMRHPIDRLVSHYVHEWTQRVIHEPIDEAIHAHPELIDYGRYHYQLQPYLAAYGRDAVLPIFLERFNSAPSEELSRICDFLGYEGQPRFDDRVAMQNVSRERLRLGPMGKWVVNHPVLTSLRRSLVPRPVRDALKRRLQMRKRPVLSSQSQARLTAIFDEDLEQLGQLLGTSLACGTFKDTVTASAFRFA